MKIRDLYVGDALQWQSGKAYKRGSNIRYGVVLSISEDKKRAMIANVFISDGKLNGGVGHHDGFRVCVVMLSFHSQSLSQLPLSRANAGTARANSMTRVSARETSLLVRLDMVESSFLEIGAAPCSRVCGQGAAGRVLMPTCTPCTKGS